MKWFKTSLVTVITFLFVQTAFSQVVLDKVVAIVDNNIILKSELEQFAYSTALQMGIDVQKEPDKFQQLLKQTLNNMIIQKVLLVKAKEDSIEVSDQQVEAMLDQQIQAMVQQLGSEKQVEEYFGMNLRQIRRDFRDEVKQNLLVRKLREKKALETQISRREVEEFYRAYRDSLPQVNESVKLSHILVDVQPSEAAMKAAREKAQMILDRLKKGEDFAELARQYSEGPSAARGGDLGLMARGDLVKEFEEVAFNLQPGEISGIVRTQFGLHIIQLVKKVGEKINARHILIRVDTSPEDAVRTVERLKKLRQRILDGEISFEDAAKQFSKDKSTAEKGGDLGWFDVEQFEAEEFKSAVAGLQVGEISEPVKTKFGYHLIRLDARRPARKLSIKDDWEQIETWALDLKRRKQFEQWVDTIKKDVYIEIKG